MIKDKCMEQEQLVLEMEKDVVVAVNLFEFYD